MLVALRLPRVGIGLGLPIAMMMVTGIFFLVSFLGVFVPYIMAFP
jgi:hypothetical protein